jgi:hypothetical protein
MGKGGTKTEGQMIDYIIKSNNQELMQMYKLSGKFLH